MFWFALVAAETYTESLKFKQFSDGKVMAEFVFNTTTVPCNSFTLAPKSFMEVIKEFKVEELHLKFTRGRWNYDFWGDKGSISPQGVQLLTWLDKENIEYRWKGLTNVLSGLFCASLNFMDQSITSDPSSFPKSGYHEHDALKRFSFLPREVTCTENLTPWSKLLPCQSKAGISTLLNAYKIFDGNYQSIGIHFLKKKHGANIVYELTQTLTVVFDPIRTLGSKDWSIESLFERKLEKLCPLSSKTSVVFSSNDQDVVLNLPTNTANNIQQYNLEKKDVPFNLAATRKEKSINVTNPRLSKIRAHRYLGGVGDSVGKIHLVISNDFPYAVNVSYVEVIPWILKVYLHTLQVSNGLFDVHYQGAIDRKRPTIIDLSITLYPGETRIEYDFERTYIKLAEHPPDANHGFDIGSGILSYENRTTFTDGILIRVPTPDFSMPYNVITLSCTVMALFFGAALNMLTKSPQVILEKK